LSIRSPLHLTASMRTLKAHQAPGGMPTIAWTKRKVLEAAEARAARSSDQDLHRLAAKLERACDCTIAELAKIAETWPDG